MDNSFDGWHSAIDAGCLNFTESPVDDICGCWYRCELPFTQRCGKAGYMMDEMKKHCPHRLCNLFLLYPFVVDAICALVLGLAYSALNSIEPVESIGIRAQSRLGSSRLPHPYRNCHVLIGSS